MSSLVIYMRIADYNADNADCGWALPIRTSADSYHHRRIRILV